jgi:hypothetical protein
MVHGDPLDHALQQLLYDPGRGVIFLFVDQPDAGPRGGAGAQPGGGKMRVLAGRVGVMAGWEMMLCSGNE